jgi:hypothetical protein
MLSLVNTRLVVGIAIALFTLTACGSSQNSGSESRTDEATPKEEVSVQNPYPGLTFTLAPVAQRVLPYACIDYYGRGTLCTLDVLALYEGDAYIEPYLEAFALDEQGRKFRAQSDPTVSHVWPGGSTYYNPGEKLMWGMEFSIGDSSQGLKEIQIFADGFQIAALPVDVRR